MNDKKMETENWCYQIKNNRRSPEIKEKLNDANMGHNKLWTKVGF